MIVVVVSDISEVVAKEIRDYACIVTVKLTVTKTIVMGPSRKRLSILSAWSIRRTSRSSGVDCSESYDQTQFKVRHARQDYR